MAVRASRLVLLGVVLAGLVLVSPAVLGAEHLALVGCRVIDGSGGPAIEDATVVVRGARIVDVGPREAVAIPVHARVVNLTGYTVLPGFVNAHVHNGLSQQNRRAWAMDGVTTVRDLGCAPTSLAVYHAVVEETPDMARLVAAGPLITVPDGYPIIPFSDAWALPVTSVAHARAAAEDLFDTQGVDLLKLALESADGAIAVMSVAEARELVAVAHERGTVASAHISLVGDLERALSAGVDDLAHMVRDHAMTDTEIQRVIAADIGWVPTLELWECVGVRPMAVYNLSRFAAAGGRIALGTDFAGYTCDWELGMPMTEIRLMATAGMSPMAIIQAATINGARVCNLSDEIGSVTVGKVADLIAVVGNPLDDLERLDDVRLVIKDGVVILDHAVPLTTAAPRRSLGRRP